MSGGCNHFDTSSSYRRKRSEMVVGRVIRTLVEKYGLQRQEVFVNSKQGFVNVDAYHGEELQLQMEEMFAETSLKYGDFT